MKTFSFLLITCALFGAQETPKLPEVTPKVPPLTSNSQSRSMIVIDPKVRSEDYVKAFDLLHKDKPTLKISIHTHEGNLNNVTDVTSGGTLLIIKTLSNQGIKTQIVPVEEIVEITYSP